MAGSRRKPKIERKEEMIQLRVSSDEKAELEQAAKRDALKLATWLRQLALKAARARGG